MLILHGGGALLPSSTNLEGVVCKYDHPSLADVPQPCRPGDERRRQVPLTPTPAPGVDDTSWALTAQSPFPPPWGCHGDRSRRDTR